MYICPRCKSDIAFNQCAMCGYTIQMEQNIPVFYSHSDISARYIEIAKFYNELYDKMENVWSKLASRNKKFDIYVSSLIMEKMPQRYLDVGCGEGNLLVSVSALEKHGIDISYMALQTAFNRTQANLCIGFAEELPYQSAYFDVISSVGVMTHFVDDDKATREIFRVLKPDGLYVVGIFLPAAFMDRLLDKVREFIYPQLRPVKLIKWVAQKTATALRADKDKSTQRKDYQPIERYYSEEVLEQLFTRVGFVISDIITKRNRPDAPLAGHHFRIYLLHKKLLVSGNKYA